MQKTDLISYRDFLPEDENFIFATWLKGLRYGNDLFELIDQEVYFTNYRRVIRFLLPNSVIKIACLKDSPDVIVGYSVSEGSRLHWIHVKENWRKMGIAKDLLPKDFHSYSHLTKAGFEILKTHPGYIFNPFLN